jgi:hypothetical protein
LTGRTLPDTESLTGDMKIARRSRTTRRLLVGLLVLILLPLALIFFDEARLRKVKPGLTNLEVERLLGNPSRIVSDKDLLRSLFDADCEGDMLSLGYVYDRFLRRDLVVAFDRETRVRCVRRGTLVHIVG